MRDVEMVVIGIAIVSGTAWMSYLMYISHKMDKLALEREIQRRKRRLDHLWRCKHDKN